MLNIVPQNNLQSDKIVFDCKILFQKVNLSVDFNENSNYLCREIV
jgi:hypothetical protein